MTARISQQSIDEIQRANKLLSGVEFRIMRDLSMEVDDPAIANR